MKVYVHIFHGKDGMEYRSRYERGLEPDASPYGLHHAASEGWSVDFSRDGPSRSLLSRVCFRLLKFDVAHAFYNRKAIASADVFWTMTEREAFAVAMLFWLRIVSRKPIVANAVWLFNEWDKLPTPSRILYKTLSKYISVMTVHSKECLPLIRKNLPDLQTSLTYFGVNDEMFAPVAQELRLSEKMTLFAAGNDRTRDWNTFFEAFGNDDRFIMVVACQWLDATLEEKYANLTLIRNPSMRDFIETYATSDLVVVPMVENIFSGITVALEAAAMARPVLSTRTGGVPTYFDDDEICYAPPGSPVAMRNAALSITPEQLLELGARARARFEQSDYSTRALAKRYVNLTLDVMAQRAP